MEKTKNIIKIVIQRLLFFLLPIILLLYVFYELILGYDFSLSLEEVILYGAIVVITTISSYMGKVREEKIENDHWLMIIKEENRWKIIKEDNKGLVLEPRFDFPYNLLAKETVSIKYLSDKVIIEGPRYYVDQMAKDIQGRSSKWGRRFSAVGAYIFVLVILSIPIIFNSGIYWNLKIKYHNYQMRDVQLIEIKDSKSVGNTVSNSNNYGNAVETEDYILYVENYLNLIKADKDLNNKEYLIQRSGGSGIDRLSVVEDWIFYSSEYYNRMKIDGSEDTILYKMSYLMEPQVVGNWIYFINFQDNHNVYRMDVNGQNLTRFLQKGVSDLAIYDDRLFYSCLDGERGYVESIDLDGGNKLLEFETDSSIRNLSRWNNDWYYINGDYRLVRTDGKDPDVYQVPIDDNVSSYIITEEGIFYSLHGDDVGYPGDGLYKMDHIGYNKTLISDEKRVEGFAHVSNWILFSSSDDQMHPVLKRIDLNTGEIEIIE
ncbi:MAG: DUF5050 domain-containing protein [Gudongella sp.]|nr:DUF5050 domain-containing protein [Gudongella sp.]